MVTDSRSPGRPWRLLLLIDDERNESLLTEWLSGTFEVVHGDEGTLTSEFDLCLADTASLERFRSSIERERERAHPQFLPLLLVLPPDQSGTLTDHVGDALVDGVVELPAKKEYLHQRLEALLRTRRLSLSLGERELQYRRLVESLPESVFLVQDGRVVFSNEGADERFGDGTPGPQWFTDEPFATLVQSGDRDRLPELFETVLETGSLDEFISLTLVDEQDEHHACSVGCVRVTFEGQDTVQVVVRDVTDRNRREEQIRLFNRALDDAEQGVIIADARQYDEPIIYANAAFEDITGYSVAECLGRNCRFLQGEATDHERVDHVREAIEAERPVSVEIRNYRADGTMFWNQLDITPVRDEAGEVTHFIGFQRDVTERKELELRYRERTETLRTLTTNLPIIQFSLDPEGTVTHSEGKGLEALGLGQNEVVGESIFDLYEGFPDICADARAALEGNQVKTRRRFAGRVFDTWYQPLLDDDGEVRRVVGLTIDITDNQRREQRLTVLHRILRHNLRNRLAVIRGRAEAAQGLDAAAAAPHLDEILDATDELVRLADKARDVQHLFESDHRAEARDIVPIVDATVDRLRQRFPDATIDLDVPDHAVARTRYAVGLAVEQLVENAIVHTPSDSPVEVAIGWTGGDVVVDVSDEGSGLPPAEQTVLTADAESPLTHSQGLGLWLVRWVVEMAGGSVSFTVDDGTTVQITLPVG